jgi:hypothetical protein
MVRWIVGQSTASLASLDSAHWVLEAPPFPSISSFWHHGHLPMPGFPCESRSDIPPLMSTDGGIDLNCVRCTSFLTFGPVPWGASFQEYRGENPWLLRHGVSSSQLQSWPQKTSLPCPPDTVPPARQGAPWPPFSCTKSRGRGDMKHVTESKSITYSFSVSVWDMGRNMWITAISVTTAGLRALPPKTRLRFISKREAWAGCHDKVTNNSALDNGA